jgi:DNA polymerase-3 subunit alpha
MTALLTADAGDTDKISVGIHECKKMGIPVLPPDVNASFGDFAVIKGTEAKNLTEKADAIRDTSSAKDEVRFGLYTIKNLGHEIAGAIIDERKTGGKYKSFSDFLDRVKHKNLNKKSLEALVKAGAMDELGERGQLLTNIDDALLYSRQAAKTGQGQNSLFALMEDQSSVPILRLKEAPPASQEEKLLWEKELLGLYISGHPLDSLKDKLKKLKVDIAGSKQMEQGMPVVIGGMVEDVRKITTKKGDPMMFVKVSDYKATVEIVVFPRVLEDYESKIYEGNCIAVKGRISIRNGETTIIAEQIKEMKE